MDFQQTIGWILKQPIELVWQQSQPSQKTSTPFKKPLIVKQPIETLKQLVVFPLLYKTIFFKKVLIPNCFIFKQRVDYTLIYPNPTHTSSNSSLPSNTMNLETSKLQDHPWSTVYSPNQFILHLIYGFQTWGLFFPRVINDLFLLKLFLVMMDMGFSITFSLKLDFALFSSEWGRA